MPGTYLNAFYEVRPLPYAEAGYGYPEEGQTVVNVTNGKLIRLLVDDEPFDVRYGTLVSHRRTLDLRAGVLRREVHWRSPAGREIEVRSVRLVSFVQRSVAAIRYEVEPLDGETRIVAAVRARRQRGRAGAQRGPARGRDPAPRRSSRSRTAPTSCAPSSCTARARAPCGWRRGWTTWSRGRRGRSPRTRASTTSRGVTGERRGRPRRDADADQVPGLRVVQPALDGLDPRPGRRRARVGAAHGVRRPRSTTSASTSTTSGSARTSRSTATTSSSRPCASPSSTCCRPPPARRSARSPPRG